MDEDSTKHPIGEEPAVPNWGPPPKRAAHRPTPSSQLDLSLIHI